MSRIEKMVAPLVLPFLLALVSCISTGPAPCNEGGVLFGDDFNEGRDCGWALYERAGATAEIRDGALHLITSQPGQIWWTNPGRNLADVILTANVRPVEGPNDNAYGLICRYQSAENFYVFLISSDGFYAIGKYQSGNNQVTYLTGEGQYQFSEEINQGTSANQMRASCIGDELALSVNGVPVATVNDSTFGSGDIGLAASTFESDTLEVAFDDVRAIAP